ELLLGAHGAIDGCTSIGLQPKCTRNGHTLLAQNWDWLPAQRDTLVVLATRDDRGLEVVVLTEAGMLAKSGVNSAGIGVCVNILASGRDGHPGGVPYHVILRAALEATSFGEAVLTTVGSPRSASINLLIGSRSGEVVDLELTPGDAGWIWP